MPAEVRSDDFPFCSASAFIHSGGEANPLRLCLPGSPMCGRFVLMTLGRDLAQRFELAQEPPLEARYNIAPTQAVAVIRPGESADSPRRLDVMRWGLVPFWSKDPLGGAPLINARAETAATKPAFRAAYRHRRCLIPADGFYEWKRESGKKQPYYLSMGDAKVFAFAGLWEHWENPEGSIIESCAILTTSANELVQSIHDRMPVILEPRNYQVWLDPKAKVGDNLQDLLKPYPGQDLAMRPIHPKMNKASYDAADCLAPYTLDPD
jgi:putative SOS response-associated peptidase YedK